MDRLINKDELTAEESDKLDSLIFIYGFRSGKCLGILPQPKEAPWLTPRL